MFVGSPAEVQASQLHQELTVGWEEGFLGNAKITRLEPLLPQPMSLFLNRAWESLIACKPRNLWRRLVLPKTIEGWSLTSLQHSLVRMGDRLIKHARYYWLLLAERHLTRRLFGSMVRRIEAPPAPAGWNLE